MRPFPHRVCLPKLMHTGPTAHCLRTAHSGPIVKSAQTRERTVAVTHPLRPLPPHSTRQLQLAPGGANGGGRGGQNLGLLADERHNLGTLPAEGGVGGARIRNSTAGCWAGCQLLCVWVCNCGCGCACGADRWWGGRGAQYFGLLAGERHHLGTLPADGGWEGRMFEIQRPGVGWAASMKGTGVTTAPSLAQLRAPGCRSIC